MRGAIIIEEVLILVSCSCSRIQMLEGGNRQLSVGQYDGIPSTLVVDYYMALNMHRARRPFLLLVVEKSCNSR